MVHRSQSVLTQTRNIPHAIDHNPALTQSKNIPLATDHTPAPNQAKRPTYILCLSMTSYYISFRMYRPGRLQSRYVETVQSWNAPFTNFLVPIKRKSCQKLLDRCGYRLWKHFTLCSFTFPRSLHDTP